MKFNYLFVGEDKLMKTEKDSYEMEGDAKKRRIDG